MTTTRTPQLLGQTVVCLGGSGGIGLETARSARAEGAEVILVGRTASRLQQAAADVGAADYAAFDATDADALAKFFDGLPAPVDQVMVTAGRPYYALLPDIDLAEARRAYDAHLGLALHLGQLALRTVRPGGSLIFMGGTGARRPGPGLAVIGIGTVALPALVANLAVELAPTRVNLIAAGFVDTPLSASLLGDQLDARRDQLRSSLPIGRVVEPSDVAALAVHLMTNTALTGATYDIDGGQQIVGH